MKVCVHGLWHLGTVTAACLAVEGIETVGLDDNATAVADLQQGDPPLFEPGLEALVRAGLGAGRLSFTTDTVAAVSHADVVWVAFDTPVDADDRADVDFVKSRVAALFPHLKPGAVVLVSAQMPVGSVGDLERRFAAQRPGAPMHFACSPENLRLGNAIDVFTNPGRIVVGVRSEAARAVLEPMLGRFCDHLIWMSVESAEMAKHALNAFLATCITFTNELATLCERVGADAAQVEQALRSEPRVGPNAYVKAGSAFGGGTLARDVRFLSQLAERVQRPVGLIDSIIPSNLAHRQWPMRALQSSLGGLEGHTVGVLGLAYKPGTDAIRRSAAVDLCGWLTAAGARVRAHDPQVSRLPEGLVPGVEVCSTLDAVLDGAEAVVVATEWPEFKALSAQQLRARMARPLVVDPNQFVQATLAGRTDVEYLTIGKPA